MNKGEHPWASSDGKIALITGGNCGKVSRPPDAAAIVAAYADWLATSHVPRLFVKAEPGSILAGANLDFVRGWPAQTEVTVAGRHYIQEDSPDEIGKAIVEWMGGLG